MWTLFRDEEYFYVGANNTWQSKSCDVAGDGEEVASHAILHPEQTDKRLDMGGWLSYVVIIGGDTSDGFDTVNR